MMGRRHVPARVCAVCVNSEATETTEIDGRIYHVCAEHGDNASVIEADENAPIDEDEYRPTFIADGNGGRIGVPSPIRDRIIATLRHNPGISCEAFADAVVGMKNRAARCSLHKIRRRMEREGEIRRVEVLGSPCLWLVESEPVKCVCGADIVRGGERGPKPKTCRACAEQKRHGRAA